MNLKLFPELYYPSAYSPSFINKISFNKSHSDPTVLFGAVKQMAFAGRASVGPLGKVLHRTTLLLGNFVGLIELHSKCHTYR